MGYISQGSHVVGDTSHRRRAEMFYTQISITVKRHVYRTSPITDCAVCFGRSIKLRHVRRVASVIEGTKSSIGSVQQVGLDKSIDVMIVCARARALLVRLVWAS